MIGFLRYVSSFIFTWRGTAGRCCFSALIGVKQRPGGVYDTGARRWAQGMLRGHRYHGSGGRPRAAATPEPKVYISNHASFVDIWAILAEFPGTIRFVYKKGMDWIPLMGQAMRAARHIPIDRVTVRVVRRLRRGRQVRSGRRQLGGGVRRSTWSRDGRLQAFKKGPFVLAIAAGAPVVPVFCENTCELMPRGELEPETGYRHR